jgi:Tfp pilus assembly protein PilO
MSNTLRERYSRSKNIAQRAIRDITEKPVMRVYMEIFLTLVAVSLFGIFAIRPTMITIGKLLQEIKLKEVTLATMNKKIADLNTAKDLYTKESEKIKLIEEAIPNSPEPDLLALQIEELAKTDGVVVKNLGIENIKMVGAPSLEDDGKLSLTLNLSGGYSSLIKFAKDVEDLRRPIMYDGLSISSIQSKDGTSLYMTLENLSTPYTLK